MKTNNHNKIAVPQHTADEDMVAYVDGELDREPREDVRRHLESCWDCRKRLADLQRSIENFLRMRHDALIPRDIPPAGPALELFRERLAGHRTLVGAPSYFRVKLPNLSSIFRKTLRRITFTNLNPTTARMLMSSAAALIVVSLLVGILILSDRFTTVSAKELLENVKNAQNAQVGVIDQPVIHQRLNIKIKNTATQSEEAIDWEIWNDTEGRRMKYAATSSGSPPYEGGVAAASADGVVPSSSDGVLRPEGALKPDGRVLSSAIADLQTILRNNHMDPARPLSAASYQSWSDSLSSKTENVSRSDTSGRSLLTLTTVAASMSVPPALAGGSTRPSTQAGAISAEPSVSEPRAVATGLISEARLTVNANDWHPQELYLRVKTRDGQREFTLVENEYEVVSLSSLDPTFFADAIKQIAVLQTKNVISSQNPSPESDPGAVATGFPSHKSGPTGVAETTPATTEVEVDVLGALHQIGADISEQMTVTRTANGMLEVQGIVETDNRKREILQALTGFTNNSAVRINIQTIEEAQRALARQKSATQPGEVSRVEVNKGGLAADNELREYFAARGGDPDEQIRRYASRMINRSQSALFQASALNRLANRFTAEQIKSLDAAARTKLLNIVRGYAAAVRRETTDLRQELQPVFFGGGGGEADSEGPITGDADLARAINRLYDLAATNDRIVRSAFTLSTGNVSFTAIKTPQFRRSLGTAEKLAAAIEKAR